MIVEMKTGAGREAVDAVVQMARSLGVDVQLNIGTDKTVVAILGSNTGQVSSDIFAVLPEVESVTRIMRPYKLASREFRGKDTVVSIDGIEIGGERIVVRRWGCTGDSQLPSARSEMPGSGDSRRAVAGADLDGLGGQLDLDWSGRGRGAGRTRLNGRGHAGLRWLELEVVFPQLQDKVQRY